MVDFLAIDQTIAKHLDFLQENSLIQERVGSPNGFDLLFLPVAVPSPHHVSAACKSADIRIRKAQQFGPDSVADIRLVVNKLEALLIDPESAKAYCDLHTPKPKLPKQPVPVPKSKNPFPRYAALGAIVLTIGLIGFSVFRSPAAVVKKSVQPIVQPPVKVDPKPPKPTPPPGPTATELIALSTSNLNEAYRDNNSYNSGIKKQIPLNAGDKPLSLSAAKDAMEELDQAQSKPDFDRSLYATFYNNRATAKAFLSMKFEDDLKATEIHMKEMPEGDSKRKIARNIIKLHYLLPENGHPAKKILWLR